jgi:hypothetical protein
MRQRAVWSTGFYGFLWKEGPVTDAALVNMEDEEELTVCLVSLLSLWMCSSDLLALLCHPCAMAYQRPETNRE